MELPTSSATIPDSSIIIADTDAYRVYPLPADQWDARREELGYPTLPNPEHAFLIVVEAKATGVIVASWTAMNTIFLEGLHIAEAHRDLQSDIHGLLLGGMLAMLTSVGAHHPLTLAQDPAILRLARKAGFTEVAGTLLMLQ